LSAFQSGYAARAELLTIGDEILTGRTVNTNAAYLARKLTLLGFVVKRITVVEDGQAQISQAITEALSREIELLVVTGGLGPTYDDVTMESVAVALSRKMKKDEQAAVWVGGSVAREGQQMTPERLKMAYLPEGAKPLQNPVGMAVGAWIELGEGKTQRIVVLPGVPSEMEAMFEHHVVPVLAREQSLFLAEKEFKVLGIYEASLAPFVRQLVSQDELLYVKTHPRLEAGKPSMLVHVEYASQSKQKAQDSVEAASLLIQREVERLGGKVES